MNAAIIFGLSGILAAVLILAGCRAIIQIADELERDRHTGYKVQPEALPPEAKPKDRPCPPWVNRANGRATR